MYQQDEKKIELKKLKLKTKNVTMIIFICLICLSQRRKNSTRYFFFFFLHIVNPKKIRLFTAALSLINMCMQDLRHVGTKNE